MSETVILASTPSLKTFHAVVDTVPQFIPFIIVLPVEMEVISPASRLVFRLAAVSGSTVMTIAEGDLLL
jgi:hypothetical protein